MIQRMTYVFISTILDVPLDVLLSAYMYSVCVRQRRMMCLVLTRITENICLEVRLCLFFSFIKMQM